MNDDDSEDEENHEINVTPFIDVILVLLIIFMIAAPISTVDLPVDLPIATAAPAKRPDQPTYVTVKADLSLAVGEDFVRRNDLPALLALRQPDKDGRVFLRADKSVPYGELMIVLELVKSSGFTKIALVTMEGIAQPKADPEGKGSSFNLERIP